MKRISKHTDALWLFAFLLLAAVTLHYCARGYHKVELAYLPHQVADAGCHN
jgi:hypothetical protein